MEIQKLIHKNGLLRGLSKQTIKTYVYVVRKFLKSVRKEPHQVTQTDIKNFLFSKLERGSPGNTINVYLNAKIETTLIYSHLAQPKLLNIQSPFDNF